GPSTKGRAGRSPGDRVGKRDREARPQRREVASRLETCHRKPATNAPLPVAIILSGPRGIHWKTGCGRSKENRPRFLFASRWTQKGTDAGFPEVEDDQV